MGTVISLAANLVFNRAGRFYFWRPVARTSGCTDYDRRPGLGGGAFVGLAGVGGAGVLVGGACGDAWVRDERVARSLREADSSGEFDVELSLDCWADAAELAQNQGTVEADKFGELEGGPDSPSSREYRSSAESARK